MPKIKNWSRNDNVYPMWIHDKTEQRIEIGIDGMEIREDGKPKKYQITVWNGLNNRVYDFGITSLKEAKNSARNIARNNINGNIIQSVDEKHNFY